MQQVNNNNTMGILALLSQIQQGTSLPVQEKPETSFDQLMEDRVNASRNDGDQKPQAQEKPQQDPSTEDTQAPETAEKPEKDDQAQQTALTWAAMSIVQTPAVLVENAQPVTEGQQAAQILDLGAVQQSVTAPAVDTTAGAQTLPLVQGQAQETAGTQVTDQTVMAQPQQTTVQQGETQPVQATVQSAESQSQSQLENQPQTGKDSASADVTVEVSEGAAQASQPVFSQVDSIPVKVSDVPAEESSGETPSVETQVFHGVEDAVKQGDSKVTLQLTPENLGSVTVELTRGTDGALHVVLTAERMQTQNLLEKHMAGLQSMLANNSQEPVEIQVQRQQESQAYDSHNYDGSSGNGKEGYQQQDQNQQRQRQQGSDFLQQLRLGLIPMDATIV